MLGDVFDGNGVVVAPEQKGDRALWDIVTVAMVAPPKEGEARPLDGVVEQAAAAMRDAGQNFQTLQRQARAVDGNPAQMLKTRYHENETDSDWIEELVFIEGPENEVYSVSLKCAPEHLVRLEAALNRLLRSWTLQDAQEHAPAQADRAPASPQPPAMPPH